MTAGTVSYVASQIGGLAGTVRVLDSVTARATATPTRRIAWMADPRNASVTVSVGQTVEWTWSEAVALNIVSGVRGAEDAGVVFRSGLAC